MCAAYVRSGGISAQPQQPYPSESRNPALNCDDTVPSSSHCGQDGQPLGTGGLGMGAGKRGRSLTFCRAAGREATLRGAGAWNHIGATRVAVISASVRMRERARQGSRRSSQKSTLRMVLKTPHFLPRLEATKSDTRNHTAARGPS